MEQKRNKFIHDQDNRIQKLYYDVNIHLIIDKTRLKNLKNKFCKYVNYLIKYEKNNIQPNILRFQQNCWKYKMMELKEPNVSGDLGYFRREYGKCSIEINRYITMQTHYNNIINKIGMRIKQIKTHQNFVHKHYRKCAHCEKTDMVYISGCKLKHKLCSDCSYDITECPVCEKDLGLLYCAICMENKKEIIETGCENKHQTCKQCLDKIIGKNNRCPFCRDYCSKEHESEPLAIPDYWRERSEEEDEALAQEWVEAEYWRERQEVEEEHRRYREWQEEEDRQDREETEADRIMSRRDSRRER